MDVKEQVVLLSEICRHDLALMASKNKINQLTKETSTASKNVGSLETSIEDLLKKKEQNLQRSRLLDQKLQEEKVSLRKWETRAEKIKGEREYTALTSEIASQKRSIFGVEHELSEVNNEIKAVLHQIQKLSGDKEQNVGRAKDSFDAVKELLDQENEYVLGVEKAKNILLDKLPAMVKSSYSRIYKNRNFSAIAFVDQAVCQACMRRIPHEISIKVYRCEGLEQCPSCQRFLVPTLVQESQG